MTDERLNLWLGFFKFFLGTFIIGVATLLINQEIQDREIELKEMDQLGKFVEHALSEDVGIRLRFAQYFSTVTRSKELKKGWIEYTSLVHKEYKQKQTKLASLQKELVKPSINAVDKVKIESKINKIETELSVPTMSRKDTVQQLIRDNKYVDALQIDPSNAIALMQLLKQRTLKKEYIRAVELFPRLKAANISGVGYSIYPFAIYSYANIGKTEVAKAIYEELKLHVLQDISKGYGYTSRVQQLKWIQDSFRDVAWEANNPSLKLLITSYITEFDELIKKAKEQNTNP